jgi:hypothetical protein
VQLSGLKRGMSETQNEIETCSKNINTRDVLRGVNAFKKGLQCRTSVVLKLRIETVCVMVC